MAVFAMLKRWWFWFIGRYFSNCVNNTRQEANLNTRYMALIEKRTDSVNYHIMPLPEENKVVLTIETPDDDDSVIQVSSKDENDKQQEKCACTNCTILPVLTKCGVCLEPVSDKQFRNCKVCGNHACNKCNVNLNICPYCRQTSPWVENIALQRFIDQMEHPCIYFCWGCPKLLNTMSRAKHQEVCCYKTVSCSIDKEPCDWSGPTVLMEEHFLMVHDIHVERQNSIYCKIHYSRNRPLKEKKSYSYFLNCYNQIFKLIATGDNKTLCIELEQLGYVRNVPEECLSYNYGMLTYIKYKDVNINKLTVDKTSRPSKRHEYVFSKLFPEGQRDNKVHSATVHIVITEAYRKVNDV